MYGASCKLNDKFARKFLTLDGEKLIYATRQHWIALLPIFSITSTLILTVIISALSVSAFFPQFTFTFILVALVMVSFIMEITVKQVVEWYFHFYIVTSRKIVEVSYRPLFSRQINEILLDQVRCTEIDVITNGFYNEMFNIGNVLMTFDRPTHEEVFSIEKIKNPRRAAMHLGDSFEIQAKLQEGKQKNNDRIWTKAFSENDGLTYRSFEDLAKRGGV